MRLALGIGPLLDEFANTHEALIYSHWDASHWLDRLANLAADGGTEFLWNLTEIDLEDGLYRAVLAKETGVNIVYITDWELLMFCQSSNWRTRCASL